LREVGLPVVVEGDKLTVEDGAYREAVEEADVGRHVPAPAAADTERAFGRDDRPEAVPLQLVGVVAARRQPAGTGRVDGTSIQNRNGVAAADAPPSRTTTVNGNEERRRNVQGLRGGESCGRHDHHPNGMTQGAGTVV
jgi:hypothetical protein